MPKRNEKLLINLLKLNIANITATINEITKIADECDAYNLNDCNDNNDDDVDDDSDVDNVAFIKNYEKLDNLLDNLNTTIINIKSDIKNERQKCNVKPDIKCITLVPIERLLKPQPKMDTIILDSDGDDDDDDIIINDNIPIPKMRPLSFTVNTSSSNAIIENVPKEIQNNKKQSFKCKEFHINVNRLPKNLNIILKKLKLTKICNEKQIVIASINDADINKPMNYLNITNNCSRDNRLEELNIKNGALHTNKHNNRTDEKNKETKKKSDNLSKTSKSLTSSSLLSLSLSASSSEQNSDNAKSPSLQTRRRLRNRSTNKTKIADKFLSLRNKTRERKLNYSYKDRSSTSSSSSEEHELVKTLNKPKLNGEQITIDTIEPEDTANTNINHTDTELNMNNEKSNDTQNITIKHKNGNEDESDAVSIKSSEDDDDIQENDNDKSDSNDAFEITAKKKFDSKNKKHDSDTSINSNNNNVNESTDNESAKNSDKDSEVKNKKNTDSSDDFQLNRKRKLKSKNSTSKSGSNSDSSDTKKKKRKRRRIKVKNDDESSDDEDGTKKKGRKNIRKVLKTKYLEDETIRAAREEQERKKRISGRQKLYNEMYDGDGKPEADVEILEKLVLDFDENSKEELLVVDSKLVKHLKPHQGSGVKFMWDACFETLKQIDNSTGSGCILAHCMGLGKTLQVITLIHTLMAHSDETKVNKVLVICPLSTVLNWVNEFKIWLHHCESNKDIEIYELSKFKQNNERTFKIKEWHEEGGVLIMGYDMFRNLSSGTSRLTKRMKQTCESGLINPGPDLVVCDEGHLLKNSKSSLSKSVNRISTLRRIVLTGTPLQNNLNEYYCMVQFVKPNLLGKYNEYLNRFVNPITNGQYVDSTPRDILKMKRRSHILHKLLDGCVQRRDYSVLAPYLPVKHEYVLYIQLTELQVELYKHYIEHRPHKPDPEKSTKSSILFTDFQNCQRIWTHPRVLRYNSDRYEVNLKKKQEKMSEEESEGSLKNFIDDDDDDNESDVISSSNSTESDDSVISIKSDDGKKSNHAKRNTQQNARTTRLTRRTRANANDFEVEEIIEEPKLKEDNPTEWWTSMCPESELDNVEHSGKLMLLLSLLQECDLIGDKLLVFSQSLYSLDVIENFLQLIDSNTQNPDESSKLCGYTGSWSLGLDYFRLDGSTSIENRNNACKSFNRPDNPRARLFLISTRAGGLGINLVAANRVIIFDVSWNPSHDIQSIFRIYRFGQNKPCYVYRFIALGTMEEKIYERQVTKLAISKRVIDEHQIDRHYKANDLMELYKTDLVPNDPRPIPILPKDRLLASQLKKFEKIIYKYHEHDSLLENKSEETLNEDEIKAAWEEFEAEKNKPPPPPIYPQQMRTMGPVTSNTIYGFRSDILLKLLTLKAGKDYPYADPTQISQLVPYYVQQLNTQMSVGITTMYQSLIMLQNELESPSLDIHSQQLALMQQTASIMPAMTSRVGINPYSINASVQPNQVQLLQQQLIEQAQNRHMNLTQNKNDVVIELD